MTPIDLLELATVTGGAEQNISRKTEPDGTTTETKRSNYAYCVDTVRDACRATNPGFLWGTNEKGAAQCQLERTEPTCGKPPL